MKSLPNVVRRGSVSAPVLLILWAAILLPVAAFDAEAQISAPARPAPEYRNSVSAGLSYGIQNDREADYWGWSAGYSRSLVGRWLGEIALTWGKETERFDTKPIGITKTFTVVGTITYAVTNWLSLTTGLGKGFANTDNPGRTMKFVSGDLGTGISVGFATPGLPQFVRDSIGFSIAYEYNFTQKDTSVSFDVSFGWSF